VEARPKATCTRADEAIAIDGINEEWIGQLKVIDRTGLALGVKRDREFLYLAVLFSDSPYRTQVLNQGMTVWFDPDGGKDKIIGISFPSGNMAGPGFRDPGAPDGSDREPPVEANCFLVLGPGKDQRTQMGFSEDEVIQVKAAEAGPTLFYELKIPLGRSGDQPYGIGVKSDRKLGLGLTVSGRNSMEPGEGGFSRDQGGMPGGSRQGGGIGGGMPGGMGGGMPGGMGGGRPGGGMGRPDSTRLMDLWIQVENIGKAGR